ncbi:SprT family protein [Streptococcus sp. DD10]|uniref:SprT family protein n=1 Tax=Streptococcus sp. DD10 TaxID=1777878 RepID=UPI00082E8D54|nr:SprT family protein [Streptococcus sp. DD10]
MNLTEYVQQVSIEDFKKEFRHKAYWNKRLRTTGGRFFPQDGHLDFNPKIYQTFGLDIFRKIVRHELCHYHLYYEGGGYRHKDRDFKNLLQLVDGLRYAPSLPRENKINTVVHYRCENCRHDYYRKRRLDTSKYRCGKCQGKITLISSCKISR